MGEKYNVEAVLKELIETAGAEFITLQGETFGEGVQKRTYGLKGHDFRAFNLIYGFATGKVDRLNSVIMRGMLEQRGIPCVPILDEDFVLPNTIDEMVAYADGKSEIDGEIREGVVVRTDDGVNSFKAVSNEYLIWKGE